jgi:hypothetical protein
MRHPRSRWILDGERRPGDYHPGKELILDATQRKLPELRMPMLGAGPRLSLCVNSLSCRPLPAPRAQTNSCGLHGRRVSLRLIRSIGSGGASQAIAREIGRCVDEDKYVPILISIINDANWRAPYQETPGPEIWQQN